MNQTRSRQRPCKEGSKTCGLFDSVVLFAVAHVPILQLKLLSLQCLLVIKDFWLISNLLRRISWFVFTLKIKLSRASPRHQNSL